MKTEILDSTLVRCALAALLENEFEIRIQADDRTRMEAAFHSLQIFDTWQDFYKETGWERDNPEESSVGYLTGQRICRGIGGRVWYFSRLEWETSEKGEKIATVLR